MRRPRRNHTKKFKAQVALAALKSDKTLVELSSQFDVHQNQIVEWKKQLLEHASEVFGRPHEDKGPDIKALHAKIGELALENDFLEGALIKAGKLSARR
jgi:transposase-like protein